MDKNCCSVCGGEIELVEHHFPQRQAPNPKIIYASLIFCDPYFGQEFALFCSPKCSLVDYQKNKNKKK